MTGFGPSLLNASQGDHNILEFTDKAVWDNNRNRFYFCGEGHFSPPGSCIQYDEATNTWSQLPSASWWSSIGHAYDHNAFDPSRGLFYMFQFLSNVPHAFTTASSTWSDLAAVPVDYQQCCLAVTYHADYDRLIYIAFGENGTLAGVYAYTNATNSWTRIAQVTAGNYGGHAVYNPVYRMALVGGGQGNTNLYKISATGVVTAVTNAPQALDVGAPGTTGPTLLTYDPVSGNFLLFGTAAWYKGDFSNGTGTWTPMTSTPPINTGSGNGVFGAVAAPISRYGVTMFLMCGMSGPCSSPHVYLYKHSATPSGPPNPPSALQVQ